MNTRLSTYKYRNNDTIRKFDTADKYTIYYSHPETVEERKMFKDILDQRCNVYFPVIANNIALSELSHCPIEIEFYGEDGRRDITKIRPYDGLRGFVKSRYTLYDTISYYFNSTGTLRMYSEMKNRLKIKNCLYRKSEG